MPQLATVANVKDYLGITVSTYDTLLGDLLSRAESYIFDICGRAPDGFAYAAHTETLSGDGSDRLSLKYTPLYLAGDGTITLDGEDVWTTDPLNDPDCPAVFDKYSGELRLRANVEGEVCAFGTIPPNDRRVVPYFTESLSNVVVTYYGGYGTPNDALPAVLTQAAIECVKCLYMNRARDPQMLGEQLGEYSYNLSVTLAQDDEARLRRMLAPYIRGGGLL